MKLVPQGTDAVQAQVWQSGTTTLGVWPPVSVSALGAVDVATGERCSQEPFDDGTVRCAYSLTMPVHPSSFRILRARLPYSPRQATRPRVYLKR